MTFNFNNIRQGEFFIAKINDDTDEEQFFQISIDHQVAEILKTVLLNTKRGINFPLEEYSPTEKYSSEDVLQINLNNDYVTNIANIYNMTNITLNNAEIQEDIDKINYYFVKFTDNHNNKLIGIRRATYFKAVTTDHNWLINYIDNTLTNLNQNIFKIDKVFDLLIYDGNIIIKSHAFFEKIAELGSVVKVKSIENVNFIETQVPTLAFTNTAIQYIESHISAARLVASISKQPNLINLNQSLIIQACQKLTINVELEDEKINIDNSNALNFLKMLDRRLYAVDLTGESEIYEAKSKSRKSD